MVVRELLIGLGFNLDESKIKRADQGIANLKNHAETATAVFARLAAVVGLVFGAQEIVKTADEWTNVYSRIGLVTKSTAEQAEMQQKVFEIAQRTRQEYASTGDLYTKLARNSGQLGATQQDVLAVTETVNEALVIGGASSAEAKATILQLGQALASGRLQGDELRSLAENAPLLMQSIADFYGVTIGKLKDMGAEGQLTSEGIFKAILRSKAKMDREFAKMPVTIEQSVTYALNNIGRVIFNLNKETSVFQHIAGGIVKASDAIAGAIEKGKNLVGGWGNGLKLAGLALVSFGVGFGIFSANLVTFGRWIALFRLLRMNILSTARAFLAFLFSPAFLMAAAITAGLILLALALEDIYYWITGGDSVLGDWLGSWDDFKSKVGSWIGSLIDQLIAYWENLKNSVVQTIDDMIGKVMEWIDKIRSAISWLGLAISKQGSISGVEARFGFNPSSIANIPGGNPYTVNQNVEVNQTISSNQPVTDAVKGATLSVGDDLAAQLGRGAQYAIPGGAG